MTKAHVIEDGEVDVIINVVDASSLERNLYLTLQLLELKKPVILALNMMDIVEERGMEIDLHRLPEMLGGIPVVPVCARRKRTGLDVLMHAVVHHYDREEITSVVHHHVECALESRHAHEHREEFTIMYSDQIEDKTDIMRAKANGEVSGNVQSPLACGEASGAGSGGR